MFNFLSGLIGFICQEQVFSVQYNVLSRLLPRELCLTIFPIKCRLDLTCWGLGCSLQDPKCIPEIIVGWKLILGSIPLEYVKDSSVIWQVFCRVLPCALLSYLPWGFLPFESSQEGAGAAALPPAMPFSSGLSPWELLFQPQAVHVGFFKSSPILMKAWY